MVRKAFIDWVEKTQENKLESGKEYMVAQVQENTAKLAFATWYDECDKVPIKCETPYAFVSGDVTFKCEINIPFDEMTEFEKETQLICCGYTMYTVPESGFYVKINENHAVINERLDSHKGSPDYDKHCWLNCVEKLVKVEDVKFFAEEPIVPEGYLTVDQKKRQSAAIALHREKQQEIEFGLSASNQ